MSGQTKADAAYTKLRDGRWGIRVSGPRPDSGQVVTVTKKDGSTKTETVDKVLWSGDGFHLCAVKEDPTRERGGNVCAECGRPGRLVADLEDGMLKHYNCCDIPP